MRRIASLALLLISVLPCFMFLLCGCAGWNNADYENCEYFAATDANGKEYVYAAEETEFLLACRAFLSAAKANERPDWLGQARAPLLLEWIRDGHALQYRLYLYPEAFAVYIEDMEENGAYPAKADSIALLSAAFARPSLRGNDPPAVLLNGQALAPSICSWSYVGGADGHGATLQSGDYLNQSAETYLLDIDNFFFEYAATPSSVTYTVYRGEEQIATPTEQELAAALAALPAGEYQLVAVCLWNESSVLTRAGYSFAVSIP